MVQYIKILEIVFFILLSIGAYIGFIFLVQKEIYTFLLKTNLQVEKFENIFYIKAIKKNNEIKNKFYIPENSYINKKNKAIKIVAKDFKTLKTLPSVRKINKLFGWNFNIFYEDNFLDNRLLFTSDNKEAVQMEIDYIKKLIKEYQIQNKKQMKN